MIRPSFCDDDACFGPYGCVCEEICRKRHGTCNAFPCWHAQKHDDEAFDRAEIAHDRIMEDIAIYRGRDPEDFYR